MGKVVKTIFGGKDSSAQKGQAAQNAAAIDFIKQQADQGRGDTLKLAPSADTNRNLGYQAAIDVFKQSIPAQIDAFTTGNQNAQNAILGLSGNIQEITPRLSGLAEGLAGLKLPDYVTIQDALAAPNLEQLNKVSNIKTNADLLRAAANGEISGLSPADRAWFSKLLSQTPSMSGSSNYVIDPTAALSTVTGATSGLTGDNQVKMQNLLTAFARMKNG